MFRVLRWIILLAWLKSLLCSRRTSHMTSTVRQGPPNGLENSLCIMKLCNIYYDGSFFKGYGLVYEAMRITEEYGIVRMYRRSVKHCETWQQNMVNSTLWTFPFEFCLDNRCVCFQRCKGGVLSEISPYELRDCKRSVWS